MPLGCHDDKRNPALRLAFDTLQVLFSHILFDNHPDRSEREGVQVDYRRLFDGMPQELSFEQKWSAAGSDNGSSTDGYRWLGTWERH
jgi:hypothetical protein